MNSGKSDVFLGLARLFGCLTIKAACAVSGKTPNAAAKVLARSTGEGWMEKEPFIHPRCYWHPRRPLGAQGLILKSSILFRCTVAEKRIWEPEKRQGPATIVVSGGEKEALFVDYGAAPRRVAAKLAGWCQEYGTSGVAYLGIVVPTAAKAEAISGAIQELPLPVRFAISEDLWSLTCATARR